jgi:Flp pilus assembly protein TadB
VERPYEGEYQGQESITPREIADIRQRRGYALSEVIKNMQSIARDVSDLKNSVKALATRTEVYMGIFVAAIVALVIAAIAGVFG